MRGSVLLMAALMVIVALPGHAAADAKACAPVDPLTNGACSSTIQILDDACTSMLGGTECAALDHAAGA